MQNAPQKVVRLYNSLASLGVSHAHADQLRKIEMTLHRWAEHMCNGDIERDDLTDKPYRCSGGRSSRTFVADYEKGALKRLSAIMGAYPELVAYHQGDPRGCALYLVKKSDLGTRQIRSCYSSVGLAVCY